MYNTPEYNPPTPQQLQQRLRNLGVAPTAQRVRIAAEIFAAPQHFSADQLFNRTNAQGRGVSKATIYNTLELFARKGIIRELVVDPTRIFYDSTPHPHYHFYDPDTGELSDIPADQVSVQIPQQLPPGTEVAGVEVIIHLRRRH